MIGVFSALEVAASGLSAERTRMNTIASNLANARTTRTAEGGPYKRLDPVFEIDLVREARRCVFRYAISNSAGFGGHNCVLTFERA